MGLKDFVNWFSEQIELMIIDHRKDKDLLHKLLLFKSIYWSKSTGTDIYIYICQRYGFFDFNKCVDENNNKLYRQRLIK